MRPSPNPSQGEVPEKAVEDLYAAMPSGSTIAWTKLAPNRKDAWHQALAAALPAIRSQIDQEWEERLRRGDAPTQTSGPGAKGTVWMPVPEHEERLKEVERQRDEAQERASRADQTTRRVVAERDAARAALGEALEKYAAALRLPALSQPSSTPFQQDRRYTTEQARMRLREAMQIHEWPKDGTSEEYFIRAVFPDDQPLQQDPEVGGDEQNWLIGPSEGGPRVLDGPAVDENIAVVPEHRLRAAEGALFAIAAAREPNVPEGEVLSAASPSYRLWDRVKIAHAYFEGRTVWHVQDQPEADPEVPRCGESERVRLWDALRLLAITHFDHERLITDEEFDCTDLFEEGKVQHVEIGQTGEKDCHLTAEGMEAIQEALGGPLNPALIQPHSDCQPTPELLGEEAAEAIRELDEIAMAAWRAREALHLNLAELGRGLDSETTKALADLVNDLNEHMPLSEDGRVWRMRKVVRRVVEDCERGEGHARGEDAEAARPDGAAGPVRTACQSSSASRSGLQEGTGEIGGADPIQPVQPEPSRLPDSTPEANAPLASTQPVSESPGNSGVEKLILDVVGSMRKSAEGEAARSHDLGDPGQARAASGEARGLARVEQVVTDAFESGNLTQPVPGNSGGVEEGR
jgi:hypothetical protein